MADVDVGLTLGHARPEPRHRPRPVERLRLALLVDTQQDGTIWRTEIRAHDVAHLLDEEAESLKCSDRCGCRPKRPPDPRDGGMRDFVAFANGRVLQCVAAGGGPSKVRVITSSTFWSRTVRGAPGRGSWAGRGALDAEPLARHFYTVAPTTCSRRATS